MSQEKQGGKKRLWILLIVVLIILLVLLGLKACSMTKEEENDSVVDGNAVERFHLTKLKHGFVDFSSKKDGGEYGKVQKFEYWFDGTRYRITWYNEDGSVRLHMISPDGKKMYHCSPEKETSVISYTGPEFHHWIFNGPEDYELGDGVVEDGLTVYTYTTKKLWEIEGASQTFYCEDVSLYTQNDTLVKIITRTNSKIVEESDLVISQYVITEQDNDVKYQKDLFELPYEIVNP